MFTSQDRLRTHTKPHDLNRFEFLKALVKEFQTSPVVGDREQVAANLANFAYDPINSKHLRALNILDLFLDCLTEQDNPNLMLFGSAGLCNASIDEENRMWIAQNDGIEVLLECLGHAAEEVMVNCLTTLIYLDCPPARQVLSRSDVLDSVRVLISSSDPRVSNLAQIFCSVYGDAKGEL
eukprot:c18090_g1_i3.p2 GENE.c18090_g1_i3~~c18090_g1_i3.p2  ORF type:complete len:180 (-),score=52.92 c18090_g1_i3:795-1334(-)